jgi:hypothetical protein
MHRSMDPCDPEAGCTICPLFESDLGAYTNQNDINNSASVQHYNQPAAALSSPYGLPFRPGTTANYFGVSQGWTEFNPSYNGPNLPCPSENAASFSPFIPALPMQQDLALQAVTTGKFFSQGAPSTFPGHGDVVSLDTSMPNPAVSAPMDWIPSYHGNFTLFDSHGDVAEPSSFQSQARSLLNLVPTRPLEQSLPYLASSSSMAASFAFPFGHRSTIASKAGRSSSTKITKRTGPRRQHGRSSESCELCRRPNKKVTVSLHFTSKLVRCLTN